MGNITLTVQDDTCHTIRGWCAERDVAVSRLVQIFFEDLSRLKSVRLTRCSRSALSRRCLRSARCRGSGHLEAPDAQPPIVIWAQ